ncbi:DUF4082 domain-containing protein [Salana multivorans]
MRARLRRLGALLSILALSCVGVIVSGVAASASLDPCVDGGNAVVCENAKPGTDPDEWEIDGAGDPLIQGFATDISVDAGERIDFKIDTDATDYTIDIYRTGYYQGLGARYITSVPVDVPLPQVQPECVNDVTTELYDCGSWGVSAHWNVPSDATSGVYIANLTRTDTRGSSHITFIVRDDDSTSDIVFQTSDPTWHAYNTYGGSDFYQGAGNGRAYKVSYNRPFATRGGAHQRDFYFASEYPLVRFLEQNGYDVSYIAGVDTDRQGELLLNHGTFLSVGHDEYWSGQQRTNVEAARDAGVNLAFLTGNEVYWRTRWEPSVAGTPTDYRTLVSYKETWGHAKIDPATEWTGTWRDPRFAPTTAGANTPENALTGTMYMVNYSDLAVTVSAEEGKLRLWRNTGLENQAAGTATELAPHTVGYESNEDVDNGHRPPGLIRLSTTEGDVPEYLRDFGNIVTPGRTTHHVTLYRAASGALVFSSASVQWTWGLDQNHDGDGAPADVRMRQATLNLLADMGNQPVTRAADLVAATASTDTTGPTTVITSPTQGAGLANGAAVTVTGTASDVGGRVAGVEVSIDGGATWHPAEGREQWTYTGIQQGLGQVEILARAADDSANLGAPSSLSVEVDCPCSVLGDRTPEVASADDPGAVELGMKFSPTVAGYVEGVRFYKGALNTGTHTGTLWSETGQALATVTFTDESETGWQEARFSQAVPVSPGVTYVVSYSAPNGGYAVEDDALYADGLDAGPLTVPGGFGADAGSVFGNLGQFPNQVWYRPLYFVDVLFSTVDSSPLVGIAHAPADGTVSVTLTSTVSVTLSRNVLPESVVIELRDSLGQVVPGATAFDVGTRRATFTPTSELAGFVEYTATVTATADDGRPLTDGGTWTFRTQRPDSEACPCGLLPESAAPQMVATGDTDPVTLSTRFTPTHSGQIVGVEFYKPAAGVGPYTVYVWGPDRAVLATAQVTDLVTEGWQEVALDTPVPVNAGQDYTVGYRTESGRYAVSPGGWASPTTVGYLTSPANAGGYTYGTGYPATQVSTSYLVDVRYQPDALQPTVLSTVPAGGALAAPVTGEVSVSLSDAVAPGAQLTLADGLGQPVDGVTTIATDGLSVTFVPSAALTPGGTYVATFSGTRASDEASYPTHSWSFMTADDSGCPCTAFGSETPAVPSAADGATVELGTAFVPESDATVVGVRFYKSPDNTGQHTGSLWSAAGERLATATFTNETTSGWQTVLFATPVDVEAGQQYVASYLAPQGHYAADTGYFTQERSIGLITLPVDAGRYRYDGGFPQYTFGATNYYVDPVLVMGDPRLSMQSPAAGAPAADPATTVSARLSYVPVGATPTIAVVGPAGSVDGTTTLDTATRTVTFTPQEVLSGGTGYTVTVSLGGDTLGTWSFTTASPPTGTEPQSLWALTDTPAVAAWNDPDPVQIGTRLRADVDGTVVALRFYKGAGNTGTHTGYLWAADETLLASGTFTNESETGWQTLELDTPVPVTAGTQLVASYFAPNGRYAVTAGALAEARSTSALTSLAQGGTFRYGTGFPTETVPHSYWVDVVLVPDAAP